MSEKKQANPNIGHIECPICRKLAAVRRNKAHKLYFDCMECGRIYPNHAAGQRYVLENAKIWPASGAPEGVPEWIAKQWSYAASIRGRDVEKSAAGSPVEPVAVVKPEPAPPAVDLPPPPPRREVQQAEEKPKKAGFSFW